LNESSCVSWRPVSDPTRRQTCPFRVVSRMDQRSIILYLHLKGLSAHAVHDDLVAAHGPKAVAYGTRRRHLCEAKLGTAEVTLGPEPSSPHLDDCDLAILAAPEEKKSRFRPCENLPEPPKSQAQRCLGDSPNRSGSRDVFFTGFRTFDQGPRRSSVLNYLCLYCGCSRDRSRGPGMMFELWMSHDSRAVQTMNRFGLPLVKKFARGHVSVSVFKAQN
jgi:hypothetical protein